jgi:hypothetical protein
MPGSRRSNSNRHPIQVTKIETLIEEGGEFTTLGKLAPFDCVATATDDVGTCLTMLVRRDGETLNQLIKRLDKAIHLAWTD